MENSLVRWCGRSGNEQDITDPNNRNNYLQFKTILLIMFLKYLRLEQKKNFLGNQEF